LTSNDLQLISSKTEAVMAALATAAAAATAEAETELVSRCDVNGVKCAIVGLC